MALVLDGLGQTGGAFEIDGLGTDTFGGSTLANPTVSHSGSQTAVISTEHVLADENTAGIFRLEVDLANLADGDVVEIRPKHKQQAGGTARTVIVYTFADAQPTDEKVFLSDYFENANTTDSDALEFTLKQTAGTGRAFPWTVYKYS